MKTTILLTTLLSFTLLYASSDTKQSESVVDTKNRLEWQDSQQIESYEDKWGIANGHCEGLNLGDHKDWRLPTNKELIALAKNAKEKKQFSYLSQQVFWTSQEDPENEINAFTVYIGNGHLSSNDECDANHIICVRDQ